MTTLLFTIPLGYQIQEENQIVSLEQARSLLLTKKRKRYTRAQRENNTVTLTKHFIRCPCCHYKIYVTPNELNRTFGTKLRPSPPVSKESILQFTSNQLSIFQEEQPPLILNRVVKMKTTVSCPKCKNTMQPSNKTRMVEITHTNHKISIRAQVLDVEELFRLPPFPRKTTMSAQLPLFEVVCFNFKNGRTYLQLETLGGKKLAVQDVTTQKTAWEAGVIQQIIAKNKLVKRSIYHLFSHEWGQKIPFFASELGVNELRMLTAFIGYNRNFYSAIPFEKGSFTVEKSFQTTAKALHKATNAVLLFRRSKLPQMKSIKKVFFNNSGLLFYIKECECLWEILQNPDHFVTLLKEENIFQILADLHMRPSIFSFIQDYVKAGKLQNLFQLTHTHWQAFCKYAINYGSMTPYIQKSEQTKWRTHEKVNIVGSSPPFSIPMCSPTERIRNCTIDDFEFAWLTRNTDYLEAGIALNNCLKRWQPHRFPVVCVRKNGKIIAAIEVRNNFVFQAYTANNQSMDEIPGLRKAYAKWYKKNRLSEFYVPPPEPPHLEHYLFALDDDLPL